MTIKSIKKYFIKKTSILIFIFFLILAGLFSFPQKSSASMFDGIVEDIMGIVVEAADWVYEYATGAGLAEIKQEAAELINSVVSGGVSVSVIGDWEDFLYKNAENHSKTLLNDYLTEVATSGKSSSLNYISKESASSLNLEGVGENCFVSGLSQYDPAISRFIGTASAADTASLIGALSSSGKSHVQSMVESAKAATYNSVAPVVTYVGNPATNLLDNKLTNIEKFTSGINNDWAFTLNAESRYDDIYGKTVEKAKAMGVAGQGFVGKISNGIVQTPGSVYAGLAINAKDVGNKILAGATTIPEALIAAATNIATGAVKEALSQGISNLQFQINKKTSSLKIKIGS